MLRRIEYRQPTGGMKGVEISLQELDGEEVILKENVVFSSKVNQPVLCHGRFMEQRASAGEQQVKGPFNCKTRPWLFMVEFVSSGMRTMKRLQAGSLEVGGGKLLQRCQTKPRKQGATHALSTCRNVQHRARPDRRERNEGTQASSVPETNRQFIARQVTSVLGHLRCIVGVLMSFIQIQE